MSTTSAVTQQVFELMRDYIEKQCGISLAPEKAYLIETRLKDIMLSVGCPDFNCFYAKLNNGLDCNLRELIIDAMTTNETLWFRDSHPYEILRDVMLPSLAKDLISGERDVIRIWSGASSTGQEAYSIAITIHEYCRANPGVQPHQFQIVGTDISPTAIGNASTGRYDAIAMNRGITNEQRERYFRQDGEEWEIIPEIKEMATFQKFNLQDSLMTLGRFDIVFVRYVAIYFSDEFKSDLFDRVSRISNKPGYLIIGAVESLRGIAEHYEYKTHGNGVYYELQE